MLLWRLFYDKIGFYGEIMAVDKDAGG